MPPANKKHLLRGVRDYEPEHVTMRDVAGVGGVAWNRWHNEVAYIPIRDLIALVYAEGLYHGAMLTLSKGKRDE